MNNIRDVQGKIQGWTVDDVAYQDQDQTKKLLLAWQGSNNVSQKSLWSVPAAHDGILARNRFNRR